LSSSVDSVRVSPLSLHPGSIQEVLPPGRSQTEAARALAGDRRRLGRFAYQWLFPGPNSKNVLARGEVLMPDAYGTPATVLTYQVPEGMRFSLRGIVIDCSSPDWSLGSGDIVFTVRVTDSVGDRPVDNLGVILTTLGSLQQPYPIIGRLEFQSNTIITVTMTPAAVVTLEQGYGFAHLVGHTYPNAEAGDA
jgi:hypothetical protein